MRHIVKIKAGVALALGLALSGCGASGSSDSGSNGYAAAALGTAQSGFGSGDGSAGQSSTGGPLIGFLYQLSASTDNQLYSYGISADSGVLTPLGSPTTTGPSPTAIAVAPGGSFVYVINGTDSATDLPGSISTFAVSATTGALTPVGSPVAVGTAEGARQVAISASGYLFVYDTNGGDVYTNTPAGPQSLIEYALDPMTGVPSLIGTVLTMPSTAETKFTVTADGRFLCVLTGSPESTPATSNTLTVYAIDPATGALIPGSSISPGNIIDGMVVDPKGRFLYVTIGGQGTTFLPTGSVQTYDIDSSSGALTPVGMAIPLASDGSSLTIDPTGSYLYSTGNDNFQMTNDAIQTLSIDQTTGSVSVIGSTIDTQFAPNTIVSDPSGQFVFVQSGWSTVTFMTFTISTNSGTAGQLTQSGPGQASATEGGGPFVIVE